MDAITSLRLRLLDAGHHPAPANGKRPGIRGWQRFARRPPTESTVEDWSKQVPDATGTGIVCGHTRAIDIDVDDPKLSIKCRKIVQSVIGDYPPCRIGRWPRVMLFGRSDDASRPTTRRKFEGGGIEYLGDGAFAVVEGIHPYTDKPYYWDGDPLWETFHNSLPLITAEQEAEIVDRVGRLLGGATSKRGAGSRRIPVGERNTALFRAIKNHAALCRSEDELRQWAMDYNAKHCQEPLPEGEVIDSVRSAWRYKTRGSLMLSGRSHAVITADEYRQLMGAPDALSLYIKLKLSHGAERDKPFALSARPMATSNTVGMGEKRIRAARHKLISEGFLQRVGGRVVVRAPTTYRLAR